MGWALCAELFAPTGVGCKEGRRKSRQRLVTIEFPPATWRFGVPNVQSRTSAKYADCVARQLSGSTGAISDLVGIGDLVGIAL